MPQCERCRRLPKELRGAPILNIPELAYGLRLVSDDDTKSTTIYQCTECGQLWKEYFKTFPPFFSNYFLSATIAVRKLRRRRVPAEVAKRPPIQGHPPSPTPELTPVDLLSRRILDEFMEAEAWTRRRPQRAKGDASAAQDREICNAIQFGDSRIDLDTTRFDPATNLEVLGVVALQGERPRVSVHVNGELLAGYRLDPCRKSDDYRGLFLHASVRIVPGLGLMIDGLLSFDRKDESQHPSDSLRGVRFQPFKLAGAAIPNSELFGRGLFARGLHFPGRVTPGDIRVVCLCDQCSEPFTLEHCHTGFSDAQYFYCETGIHTLLVSLGDLEGCPPPRAQDIDEQALRAVEARLPPCADCGKPFRYYNPLRCRSCGAPFIDFEKFPEIRSAEYYAQILSGTKSQTFEPEP